MDNPDYKQMGVISSAGVSVFADIWVLSIF